MDTNVSLHNDHDTALSGNRFTYVPRRVGGESLTDAATITGLDVHTQLGLVYRIHA